MKKIILFSFIIALSLSFSACNFSFTTANLQNIQTASQVDEATSRPITITSTFKTDSPAIYVTGTVNNAPEGTKVTAEWIYIEVTPVVNIDSATYAVKGTDTALNFSLSKPPKDWPTGKYEVKLYIDDKYIKSANFNVQ